MGIEIPFNPIPAELTGKFHSISHPNACGAGYSGTVWYFTELQNGYQRAVLNPQELDLLIDENGDKIPSSEDVYQVRGHIFCPKDYILCC